ncbi:MAG: histidinol-phosphate aminotransferase family protein, partial [Deltaproteobacteria bacterium]|nr:histidinol-phosphate aminotransferase family protein [Deltaproteobacteria bacterium]
MIFRKSLRRAVPYQIHAVSRRDRIRLDMNENPLLCSRKVTEALKNISSEDVSIYPEYGDFIEKIARFHGLKPENFLLANGADDAIRAVVDACVESGDEAVKLSPTYAMHEIFLRVRNAKIVEVKYKDFVFPAEEILKRISRKTRLVIIVNPDSPTGISAGKKVIIEILKRARRFNAAVLLDETYCHFAGGTYARLVKVFDNLVVVHSFAKVFGLAGLRLGLIISNRANIKELSKTSLPYAAGSAAVIAGSAAIEDREFIARVIRETSVEKNFLFRELKKIVSDVRMTGTNFLIVFFGAMEATIRKRLAEKGILVRGIDQKSFLKGYARLSP